MTTTKQRRTAIAVRLREQRSDAGLTQETLAKKAGLDRKTVNRIENALFSPSVDTIYRLCGVLGTTPSDFLERLP